MQSIFRTAFYLRSNYVNKEGKTPVMLRIYLNNERMSLGFHWHHHRAVPMGSRKRASKRASHRSSEYELAIG